MTLAHETMESGTVFRPGYNCRAVEMASYASPLIDCANYYQALHESIRKAQHSIFVLGWDIDGRIKLLRNGEYSHINRFFELICWQAQQKPQLQIFLNRWDYSLFMAQDREAFGSWRWRHNTPPNVHYCLDGAIPTGSSQHQKIIVIDDEVAFCGGMDIALNRWDRREHMPRNYKRIDPGPIDSRLHVFAPYHDAQMAVAGSIVQPLATIVRERWFRATEGESIPLRELPSNDDLPDAWPQSVKPVFRHVRMAVSETQPDWEGIIRIDQVETLYIDMINRAERFIYIENQFLSHEGIAYALNQRLYEKPQLRVLIVSNLDPRGIMERKALWHGRVRFRDIIEANGVKDRVTMAYVISRTGGIEKTIRIHSKLMIVDDSYLRIGSSNINNRSMYMDTECDLVIEAQDEATRQQIRDVRNDLIREHTGQEIDAIDRIIRSGGMPSEFLNYLSHSRQHLCKINDEQYRHERFSTFARRVADPCNPLIPVGISMVISKVHVVRLLLVIMAVAAAGLVWQYTPLAAYATPEQVIPLLEEVRHTPWAVLVAMAVYTIGTLLFFPHMVMTATIVVVFAPLQAFSIAMIGSLVSGAIGFFLGHKLGLRSMRALVGNAAEKISGYAKRGGLVGITLLRLLPVAPYTAVNLVLGMLEVPFWIFMVGTFLGTLPGTTIAAFLGHSALEVWQNPSRENVMLLAGGLVAWVAIVVLSHLAGRLWRKRYGSGVNQREARV